MNSGQNPGQSQGQNPVPDSPPTSSLSAAEFLLYAPLGIALKVGEKALSTLPELIETGRVEYARRAPVARMMGKLIVDQQRKKRRAAGLSAVATRRPSQPPAATAQVEPEVSDQSHVSNPPGSSPVVGEFPDLAIDGYDTIPARSLLPLFDGLTNNELTKLLAYEQANRQRATVMNRLTELLG